MKCCNRELQKVIFKKIIFKDCRIIQVFSAYIQHKISIQDVKFLHLLNILLSFFATIGYNSCNEH